MKSGNRRHIAKNAPVEDTESALGQLTPEDANLLDADELAESWDFDEHRSSLGREYKIEVNWDGYDEPQVQLLLAILFQSVGYRPDNLHEADRAREEGADLVLSKPKHTIALAVKKKPKSSDRQQLSDLSKRGEDERIYVYTQTPSVKFLNSMGDYKGIVDFWDRGRLNEFFATTNLGLTVSLIFDDSDFSRTVRRAQTTLLALLLKCRRLEKRAAAPLDSRSFRLLFRLKDEGVSLHKTNQNVVILLERPINLKSRELDEHFCRVFLQYLDILNGRLTSFLGAFDRFYVMNEDLVHNSIIENDGRSHWLHLTHYGPDNTLPALKKELREAIDASEALKKLKKTPSARAVDDSWKEIAKNNDVWAEMESRVRRLMVFGAAIEAIVDDIVDEYAREYEKHTNP